MLVSGTIGEGHARALLALSTRAEQLAWAERIASKQLSVRVVEAGISGQSPDRPRRRQRPEKPAHIKALEHAFSRHLSTRVAIDERRNGKGKIVIEFFSHDDFERLSELMNIPLPR